MIVAIVAGVAARERAEAGTPRSILGGNTLKKDLGILTVAVRFRKDLRKWQLLLNNDR